MSFVEFLLEYYIYIVIILILLIVTVIGFIVDSKNKEFKNNNKSDLNDLEVNQESSNSKGIEQKQNGVVENTSLDVNGGVNGNNSSMDSSLNVGQEVSFQSINASNSVSGSFDDVNNNQVMSAVNQEGQVIPQVYDGMLESQLINKQGESIGINGNVNMEALNINQSFNTPVISSEEGVANTSQVASAPISSTNQVEQVVSYVNNGQLEAQKAISEIVNNDVNMVASNVNQVINTQSVPNSGVNQIGQPMDYSNNVSNLQNNYQMPVYNNQVNNIPQAVEYNNGVMVQGINNFTSANVNNIANNQMMSNMNFNQNVSQSNSQVVNQQQGGYSTIGISDVNAFQGGMPNPMSIDTVNGVSNQNLVGSGDVSLDNAMVNGQNSSLVNTNNIDNSYVNNNNFVMGNGIQTMNGINNGSNNNIVFTTNGSKPFDVTSMFFNNNQ